MLSIDATHSLTCLPMADGGEGTTELLTTYSKGKMISARVRDPLFRMIDASYGLSADGTTAFMEMASASGLQWLKKEERNPALTSTIGTGDLIRHALDHGVKTIAMGIGGSATNDAGIGMADALGVYVYDRSHERLSPIGKNLQRIHTIDASGMHGRLREIRFTVFCDVDNPLHGKQGAAFMFAPQKGADKKMVEELDNGLKHVETIARQAFNVDLNFPGAGAGGGIPAMIKALTAVTIRSGIEFIIDFVRLDEQVQRTDLVITGEGKIDQQTLHGKVVKGVADVAKKHSKPVIAITGKNELTDAARSLNLQAVLSLAGDGVTEAEAMQHCRALIERRLRAYFE